MTIYFGDGTNQTAAASGGKWTEISDASYDIDYDSGSGWGLNTITGLGGYDILRLNFTNISFGRYSSSMRLLVGNGTDGSNGYADGGYFNGESGNWSSQQHERGSSSGQGWLDFRGCGNGQTTDVGSNQPYHQAIVLDFYNWNGTSHFLMWNGWRSGFGRTDQAWGSWSTRIAGLNWNKWNFDRIQLQHQNAHTAANYNTEYRLRIEGASY